MSFIGQFQAKLDSKNRVFLPAAFRRSLQSEASQEADQKEITLIVRRDFFENCLVIYPECQWKAEIEKARARLNRFDNVQQMVYRKLISEAQELTLDANGRMLIPRALLERVGIVQEALFVGMEQTIEVWAPSVADAGCGNGEPFMSDADFAKGIKEFMAE
ncbi:MAG: cell division/cell wall cluster transcriptional repressor MraZ [Bacteroidaceae bacterium]|nr:cell division/cell wall cluster transcriptional repressor MraZ [Bacteroidaceae bacterium]